MVWQERYNSYCVTKSEDETSVSVYSHLFSQDSIQCSSRESAGMRDTMQSVKQENPHILQKGFIEAILPAPMKVGNFLFLLFILASFQE